METDSEDDSEDDDEDSDEDSRLAAQTVLSFCLSSYRHGGRSHNSTRKN